MRSVLLKATYDNKRFVYLLVEEYDKNKIEEITSTNHFYEISDFVSCTKPYNDSKFIFNTYILIEEPSYLYSLFILYKDLFDWAHLINFNELMALHKFRNENMDKLVPYIERIK